jgi:hypothetical glycosyl hydrolase
VYSWNRYTAICTSRDTGCDKPGDASVEVLDVASVLDFEDHLKRNQAAWEQRWAQSDIEIDGPARDQALVRFSIFSLLQVAPYHASNLSIPARCYAFNRYNGLYFWDGEIFLLPFYQFCQPGVARNLLEFRCSTLEGARRNAAALGASGAIFPWQGDADYGEEQAPWGLQEYLWHQNADIIYAFDQYLRATGDSDLLIPKGLEVLAETARFWMSKFEFGPDGKYHLPGTVGPDEAEEHGPDNGYTSLMARRSLEIAEHWWRQGLVEGTRPVEQLRRSLDIGEDEIAEWKVVASRIHIPEVPGHAGVPLQDAFLLSRKREDISGMTVDEFWQRRGEVQVIKQADILLAMYLLEDCFTTGQIRAGYEFYEPRTLHVSSLSLNTHAIVAAISGKQEEAYSYFLRAAGLDLDNQRNATKDGLHAAALGAVWQMVTGGFMGLRVRADHLMLNPCLPEAWKRIRFSLHYRGWQLGIEADNSLIRISVGGRGQDNSILILGDKTYALGESDVIEAAI